MSSPHHIRVIVVDDSVVVRRILSTELGKDPDLDIVATAADPYEARDAIVRLSPDILILDVQMPRMNGLTFLRKLMRFHPMPVIIVSSLTPQGSAMAFQAFECGAVAVFQKPGSGSERGEGTVGELAAALTACIKAVCKPSGERGLSVTPAQSMRIETPCTDAGDHLIAIGASTGGTQAIQTIVSAFPPMAPPTLIVQHMPSGFTASFAQRLTELSAIIVREAEDGDEPGPGLALLAPGGRHMALKRRGTRWCVRVYDGPMVRGHRPNIDVLFKSVAATVGNRAIGLILTGMGADGAEGLLDMKQAGCLTLAQSEDSCVVFGMPAEAIRRGAVSRVLRPEQMPQEIFRSLAAR